MPAPRPKYEEIKSWTRELIERALVEDDPEVLLHAVIAASMYDDDWRYAQDLCIRLSTHRHFNVRGNAVLGFGHVARVHGKLDQVLVLPILNSGLNDENDYIRSQAEAAKEDTE